MKSIKKVIKEGIMWLMDDEPDVVKRERIKAEYMPS